LARTSPSHIRTRLGNQFLPPTKQMKKYIIEPEVSGQIIGSHLNHETKPPLIEKLNYQFDDWLGDDIIAGFRCFICTDGLAKSIKKNSLSGYEFDQCTITKSELFHDLNENGKDLPTFFWLKINGTSDDDFFITSNFTLVISERALEILRQFNIDHCTVEIYSA